MVLPYCRILSCFVEEQFNVGKYIFNGSHSLVMYIHIFKHLFATGLKEKKTWKLWFLMKIEYMIHKVLFTPLPPLPPCFFLTVQSCYVGLYE